MTQQPNIHNHTKNNIKNDNNNNINSTTYKPLSPQTNIPTQQPDIKKNNIQKR